MTPLPPSLRPLVHPLAWTYGQVTRLRRRSYSLGLRSVTQLPIPVLSVGSIAMGGTGKTPIAALLAHRLSEAGAGPVGVVCGAYRGEAHRRPTRVHDAPDLVRRYGDEAVLLARWLPDALVVAGSDKTGAARLALELGARVVVMDDGFQHQRLGRRLDILVHDDQPVPEVFPLGWGREHRSSVDSAGLVWCHLRDGAVSPRTASADVVSRYVPAALSRGGDGRVVGDPGQLDGCRVCLMAGVAAPSRFRQLVERQGGRVVGEIVVRDHGRFRSRHFRRAKSCAPDIILCTEKDLVRMKGHPDLTALVCRVEVVSGEQRLVRALTRCMDGR